VETQTGLAVIPVLFVPDVFHTIDPGSLRPVGGRLPTLLKSWIEKNIVGGQC
jgi:hypothetical protein